MKTLFETTFNGIGSIHRKLKHELTRKDRDTGFSIIEMTVVLALIMIITAISVVAFSNYRKANIDSSVESDVRSAVVKVETWKALNPRGTPSETTLTGLSPSEPDTTITLTPLGNREYEIRGCNIKGKSTQPEAGNVTGCVQGFGYAFNSTTDDI